MSDTHLSEPGTATAPAAAGLVETVLAEVLRDSHRYAPGREQHRPTIVPRRRPRQAAITAREVGRDLVERGAARLGFTRSHFDSRAGAARLARVIALADQLEATYALLGDEPSRRRLVELLKLRVLGPYHAPLRVTPDAYRAKQAHVDRALRQRRATFEVSDPWFSPLSLYRIPVAGGATIDLHSHSVDVVSVFLLDQYTYTGGTTRVGVEPGDVVLDIGGCWGDTALYFASLVGPAGKVYTFEFDPESLAVMRANLALNPELASRVEIVERALWDSSGGTVSFVQGGRMTSVLGNGGEQSELAAPTITLDDFVEEARIDRLGFVKMDVEGVEANVLRGARDALTRFTPRLALAAYHKDDDLAQLPHTIDSLGAGYRFFVDTFSAVEEETVLFAMPANGSR